MTTPFYAVYSFIPVDSVLKKELVCQLKQLYINEKFNKPSLQWFWDDMSLI